MKGTRALRPRGGWQFTTAAVLAREVTARIFGPAVAADYFTASRQRWFFAA